MTRRTIRASLLALTLTLAGLPAAAATLPAGFNEVLVASGLSSPTAMQFAPDGRLFVAEQVGRLRVVRNGALLPTPFVTLTVNAVGERGLLGVAFDPAFASNQWVYVYYTATTPTLHNRISRFTANGDVAIPGSEVVIFELDNLSGASNHNGGALAFGPDGKLYAAVGENAFAQNAQSLNNVLGKILRINGDGSIPTDNPFYAVTSGNNRAIWALGLRNPFTFAFHPAGTSFFINDVGEGTWEEINNGLVGANYGWPITEGPTGNPNFQSPVYAYTHANGCAIAGGAFYAPAAPYYPADYTNDYFFADFCGGWIRRLDPAAGYTVEPFATGISSPVDLKVSADGRLYYLARGTGPATGVVYRIDFAAGPPAGSATFVGTDSATQGSWRTTYGAEGAALATEVSALPPFAQLSVNGGLSWTWAASTADVRALQRPTGNDRFAATWYSFETFDLDLNLTDGQPHQVALYAVDFDSADRLERIDVLDAGTGAVLDTRTVGNFVNGRYMIWTITGHVIFRVTRTSGANAVISGLFIGGGGGGGGGGTATFLLTDTATQGSWHGVYGAGGSALATEVSTLPPFAQLGVNGALSWTWAASTADVRALQRPAGGGRFAATWYSSDTFDLDLNLTDGQPHRVALYGVDFDSDGRVQRIDVLDAVTGAVLDSRTMSGFVGGQYAVWTITGHVIFRVTRTGGTNAVISGLFVD